MAVGMATSLPRVNSRPQAHRSLTRVALLNRWQNAPRPVRAAATAVVVVLTYGTVVHLVQLLSSGLDQYPELPGWLRIYFVALTILDPLAAVLLAWRTRAGVVLAVMVLVSDAVSNGWANYVLDPAGGVTLGRVGQAVITMLAIGACAFGPHLWRAAAPSGHHR